jgi:hypothetical protein
MSFKLKKELDVVCQFKETFHNLLDITKKKLRKSEKRNVGLESLAYLLKSPNKSRMIFGTTPVGVPWI